MYPVKISRQLFRKNACDGDQILAKILIITVEAHCAHLLYIWRAFIWHHPFQFFNFLGTTQIISAPFDVIYAYYIDL